MRPIIHILGPLAGAALLPLSPASAQARGCEQLAMLSLPDARITSAVSVPAGPFAEPARTGAAPRDHGDIPAICRVAGIASPVPGLKIAFEVWLPAPSAWSQRLLMVGNGGYGSNFETRAYALWRYRRSAQYGCGAIGP